MLTVFYNLRYYRLVITSHNCIVTHATQCRQTSSKAQDRNYNFVVTDSLQGQLRILGHSDHIIVRWLCQYMLTSFKMCTLLRTSGIKNFLLSSSPVLPEQGRATIDLQDHLPLNTGIESCRRKGNFKSTHSVYRSAIAIYTYYTYELCGLQLLKKLKMHVD